MLLRAAEQHGPLTREEEHQLVVKAKAGDKRAREKLFLHNLSWVVSVTWRMKRGSLRFEDVAQEGFLGLQRAFEKFDPNSGNRFSTYSIWWIRAFITKYMRQARSSVRPVSTVVAQEDVSLDEAPRGREDVTRGELLEDERSNPEREVGEKLHCARVSDALQRLRFRLNGIGWDVVQNRLMKGEEGDTLETIGSRWGVSRERVRQVEVQTKRLLKSYLPGILKMGGEEAGGVSGLEQAKREDSFRCEKWSCTLTYGACLKRQAGRVRVAANGKLRPTSQFCAEECAFGKLVAARFGAEEPAQITKARPVFLRPPAEPKAQTIDDLPEEEPEQKADPETEPEAEEQTPSSGKEAQRPRETCPDEMLEEQLHRRFYRLEGISLETAVDAAAGLSRGEAAKKRGVEYETIHGRRARLFNELGTRSAIELQVMLLGDALSRLVVKTGSAPEPEKPRSAPPRVDPNRLAQENALVARKLRWVGYLPDEIQAVLPEAKGATPRERTDHAMRLIQELRRKNADPDGQRASAARELVHVPLAEPGAGGELQGPPGDGPPAGGGVPAAVPAERGPDGGHPDAAGEPALGERLDRVRGEVNDDTAASAAGQLQTGAAGPGERAAEPESPTRASGDEAAQPAKSFQAAAGAKGGRRRAEALAPEQLSIIGRIGAAARHGDVRDLNLSRALQGLGFTGTEARLLLLHCPRGLEPEARLRLALKYAREGVPATVPEQPKTPPPPPEDRVCPNCLEKAFFFGAMCRACRLTPARRRHPSVEAARRERRCACGCGRPLRSDNTTGYSGFCNGAKYAAGIRPERSAMAAHGACKHCKSRGRHKNDCPRLAEIRGLAKSAPRGAGYKPFAPRRVKTMQDLVRKRERGNLVRVALPSLDARVGRETGPLEEMTIEQLVGLRERIDGQLHARYERNQEERELLEAAGANLKAAEDKAGAA